jgi:hypothetical protein
MNAIYGEVREPWWNDKPVAIVAGGRSLVGFNFDRLRSFTVLAVKGSIFDIPWATAGFGLDVPRFEEWIPKMRNVTFPVYWAVPEDALSRMPVADNLIYLRRDPGIGVSTRGSMVYSGASSGFGALQIPLLKRARAIGLFGFDYGGKFDIGIRRIPGAAVKPFRHNDQHYERPRMQHEANWVAWARNFNAFLPVKDSVRIINASPQSAITVFDRMTIDDAIDHLSRL